LFTIYIEEATMTSKYLAMLHTQQMLSEQLLSNLYKDIPKCPIDKEPNPTLQMMKSLFKPPVLEDDDDNYDFDEDEETKGSFIILLLLLAKLNNQ